MRISKRLLALLFILVLASSCAALDVSADHTPERIDWRDYLDC